MSSQFDQPGVRAIASERTIQNLGMVPPTGADESAYRYDAFISYRHTEPDRRWAKWLHLKLETYRAPGRLVREKKIPGRITRVFRDEEELKASVDLSATIDDALRSSRFLIVVCSPRAVESKWIDEEVRRFAALGRGGQIFALLVEGEPSDAYPKSLCRLRPCTIDGINAEDQEGALCEPYAPDVRGCLGVKGLSFKGRRTKRHSLLRLLAPLLGCEFDDLRQRDSERRKRRIMGAATATLVLLLTIVTLSIVALHGEVTAITTGRKLSQRDLDLKREQEISKAQSALAEGQRRLAASQTIFAEEQRQARRWAQYLNDMNWVKEDWQSNRISDMRETLARQIPSATDPSAVDLRGIEWFYWQDRSHDALELNNKEACRSLAVSHDGKLLGACDATKLTLWDLDKARIVHRWIIGTGHHGTLFKGRGDSWDHSVAFSPDDKLIAATSLDTGGPNSKDGNSGSVRAWRVDSGAEVIAHVDDESLAGRAIAFSPDGRYLLAGGYGLTWKCFDAHDGTMGLPPSTYFNRSVIPPEPPVELLLGDPVITLSFHHDPRAVVFSFGSTGECAGWLWDEARPYPLRPKRLETGNLALLDAPQKIVAQVGNPRIFLMKAPQPFVEESVLTRTLPGTSKPLASDGTFIATGSVENIVHVFDLRNALMSGDEAHDRDLEPRELRGATTSLTAVAVCNEVVASCTTSGMIQVWLRPRPRPLTTQRIVPPFRANLFYSDDATTEVEYVNQGPSLIVRRRPGGEQMDKVSMAAPSHVNQVTFSPKNNLIAVDFVDGLLLHDLLHRTPDRTFPHAGTGTPSCCRFSDDEKMLALGGGKQVYRIDADTLVQACDGAEETIALAFSPSNRFLAASSRTRLGVWDLVGNRWTFRADTGREQFMFDPAETTVYATQEPMSGVAHLLVGNLIEGRAIDTMFKDINATQVAFLPDGRRVLTASGSVIHVCSASSGAVLAEFEIESSATSPKQLLDWSNELTGIWKKEAGLRSVRE